MVKGNGRRRNAGELGGHVYSSVVYERVEIDKKRERQQQLICSQGPLEKKVYVCWGRGGGRWGRRDGLSSRKGWRGVVTSLAVCSVLMRGRHACV